MKSETDSSAVFAKNEMRNTIASKVRFTATCVLSLAFLAGWAAMGQTTVVQVRRRDGPTGINLQTTVEIHFSNGLTLTTITPDSIRLLNPAGLPVRAQLGSDIEADVVNLQPNERLTPQTVYTLEVNRKLVLHSTPAAQPSPTAGHFSPKTTRA
jgi:hypothetical protein